MSENIAHLLFQLKSPDLHAETCQYIREIKIVAYRINSGGKYPFLQVLLSRKEEDEGEGVMWSFPSLQTFTKDNLLVEMNRLLSVTSSSIKTQGFLDDECTRYFFVDIGEVDVLNRDNVCLGLLSELINNRRVYDVLVDNAVCEFVVDRYDWFLLRHPDTSDYTYPLPDVGYSGSDWKTTLFHHEFGLTKQVGKFGEYLYYRYAFQDVVDTCQGMNRYALLMERTLYITETELDEKEAREIKDLLETYDSIFVYSKNSSFIIMNDLERQVSLAYYKLEQPVWSETCEQVIM